MSTVIAQLAHMVPSDDLLEQIDVGEVFEKFHSTFKRLGDFKKIRDEHEQRSFLGRLFNRSELKNAQLDAQEVQAEFSKTLAQLMVISSLQSQQLTKQQQLLSQQQADLKAKADELAQHNHRLEQHQAVIRHQASGLRNYVTELLKVQGLTDEQGHMLIEIAEEVTSTRDKLFADFDGRMLEIHSALDNQCEQSRIQLEQHWARAEQQQVELRSEVNSQLEQHQQTLQQQVLASVEAQRFDAECQLAVLRSAITQQNQELEAQRAERAKDAGRFHAMLENLRNEQLKIEGTLRRKLLAGLYGVGLVSVVGILCAYQLSRPVIAPVSTVVEKQSAVSTGATAVAGDQKAIQ
ncbi:hypothetical protein [Pseudomonas sp. S2_F03]